MTGGMTNGVLGVLAALTIAGPALGQAPSPFLSVPSKPSPAPAPPRPTPAARPAPTPATAPAPLPTPVPAAPVATTFGEKGFHCPAAGTVVVRAAAGRSVTWTYGGADPGDPEACVMTVNGKTASYLFGFVSRDNASAKDYAAAYRKVLSGPPGTVAEFLATDSAFGTGRHWHEHFENEALDTLQVGGNARPTIRILVSEKGIGGDYYEGAWRRWFDVQTGAVIQQTYQPVHGDVLRNQDWTATSITAPK